MFAFLLLCLKLPLSGDFDSYMYIMAPTPGERYRQVVLGELRKSMWHYSGAPDSCLYLQIAPDGRVVAVEFFDGHRTKTYSKRNVAPVKQLLRRIDKCKFPPLLKSESEARWFCFELKELE